MLPEITILPSMLSADYGNLASEAARCAAAGADALHVDIMDGHFVPNLSFGTSVMSALRRATKIPLDVHLMLSNPDRYLERFIDGGADSVSIHVEADCDIWKALREIRRKNARAGLTLKPGTGHEEIFPYLGEFDFILVMTVEPGYGGQAFMRGMLPKIAALSEISRHSNRPFKIMVDGGISVDTISLCASLGATEFVAGSSLFNAADMMDEIAKLRESASQPFRNQL